MCKKWIFFEDSDYKTAMPRHGTGLGAGAFPAANKLLMRYENDRAYKLHMQKVIKLMKKLF